MSELKITIRAELTRPDGTAFTVAMTKSDCSTGDNPGFHAQDAARGLAALSADVEKAFRDHFGGHALSGLRQRVERQ